MRAFFYHQGSHRPALPGNLTPFFLVADGEQVRVQIIEIARLGQGYPVIAPEVAGLAFDPALLVGLVG
jgi:hypothetical protein